MTNRNPLERTRQAINNIVEAVEGLMETGHDATADVERMRRRLNGDPLDDQPGDWADAAMPSTSENGGASHPESKVIGDIDALEAEWAEQDRVIDETMARGRNSRGVPLDNYESDRYPKCRCGHDWHGVRCQYCACPTSEQTALVSGTAENPVVYTDQISGVRYGRGHDADDVVFDEGNRVNLGDHLARLHQYGIPADPDPAPWAMSNAPWVVYHDPHSAHARSWVLSNYPQRFIMGDQPYRPGMPYNPPLVRFWQRSPENNLVMVEGLAQVLRIDWGRHGASVALRLDPVRQIITDGEGEIQPVGTWPEGMISMEGAAADGFEPVGWLHPEDIDVETSTEEVHAWGGDVVRTHENYDVTMRINADVTDPFVRRLGAAPQTWEISG